LLAMLESISGLAGLGTAIACQRGRLTVIPTFDFSYLAFAAMWGLIIFGERPNSVAVTGMGPIAGAGTFVMTGRTATSDDRNANET
jgi:drug/metabolite transporter (DMT)-like permease